MPKLTTLNIDWIDLSELVLAHWTDVQGLGVTPSELVRLIESEIKTLQGLTDQPERRDWLIDRYTSLAAVLRQGVQ